MEKSTLKIVVVSTLIVAGASTAFARGNDSEPMSFTELDVDGNGEITTEDFNTLRENRFAAIDTDGDGSVSEAEFMAAMEDRAGERAARAFARLDADGDGVLSRDVIEGQRRGNRGERLLNRFDEDESGGISEAEYEAALAAMEDRRGGRDGDKKRR